MLFSAVGEVEHFPWGVVNNLTKASPHTLERVDVALRLSEETSTHWGISHMLSSDQYEAHFRQVRSALPELDKKVTMSLITQPVCPSSQLFAGLILIIDSSSILLMR
jgi:hypothetical protein